MQKILMSVALAAALGLSSSAALAKARIANDFTHATKMVEELDRILRIRDTVCLRAQPAAECMIEYGVAITYRIHEYSTNLRRFGLWEPWVCAEECKKSEKHLAYLTNKYGKYEISSTASPPLK